MKSDNGWPDTGNFVGVEISKGGFATKIRGKNNHNQENGTNWWWQSSKCSSGQRIWCARLLIFLLSFFIAACALLLVIWAVVTNFCSIAGIGGPSSQGSPVSLESFTCAEKFFKLPKRKVMPSDLNDPLKWAIFVDQWNLTLVRNLGSSQNWAYPKQNFKLHIFNLGSKHFPLFHPVSGQKIGFFAIPH